MYLYALYTFSQLVACHMQQVAVEYTRVTLLQQVANDMLSRACWPKSELVGLIVDDPTSTVISYTGKVRMEYIFVLRVRLQDFCYTKIC